MNPIPAMAQIMRRIQRTAMGWAALTQLTSWALMLLEHCSSRTLAAAEPQGLRAQQQQQQQQQQQGLLLGLAMLRGAGVQWLHVYWVWLMWR
jgi:hypothetical protein